MALRTKKMTAATHTMSCERRAVCAHVWICLNLLGLRAQPNLLSSCDRRYWTGRAG